MTDFSAAARTDTGRRRELNEDAYLADHPLYIVADGMGGHRGGEVASELAIGVLKDAKQRLESGGPDALRETLLEANRAVFERGQVDPNLEGMGTTVTAGCLDGDALHIAHVGDSRAYLLRGGTLSQLTEDQTLVAQWEKEGKIEPGEAARHPQRNILTQAVGSGNDIQVDLTTVELRPGDRVLFASDGLHGMIDDEAITRILADQPDADEACRLLIDAANEAGGDDNITVLLLDAVGDGSMPADDGEATGLVAPVIVSKPTAESGARRRERRVPRWVVLAGAGIVFVGLLAGLLAVRASRPQYLVGTAGGRVAILQGSPGRGGAPPDAEVVRVYDHEPLNRFSRTVQRDLRSGIPVGSLAEAEQVVATLPRALGPRDTPTPAPTSPPPTASTPPATPQP